MGDLAVGAAKALLLGPEQARAHPKAHNASNTAKVLHLCC